MVVGVEQYEAALGLEVGGEGRGEFEEGYVVVFLDVADGGVEEATGAGEGLPGVGVGGGAGVHDAGPHRDVMRELIGRGRATVPARRNLRRNLFSGPVSREF